MAALAPVSAAAQVQVQPPLGETSADYRFQVGPVGLAPTFVVENLGIDTNATLSEDKPVRDFTVRVTPGTAYLLPMQRLKLYGTSTVSLQHYRKTTEQRGIDVVNAAALSFSGNRFWPRVFGSYGRQRIRPNAEIEVPVARLNRGFGVGADYRFSPKFAVEVEAARTRQDFEERLFRGGQLNVQLDRTTESVRGGARIALTPLTTIRVSGVNDRERFQFSPHRDAESLGVLFGVETKPSALIAGSATFGFRRFNALSETIPDYQGLVADVGLSYTLLDRTRFSVTARRGVEFSSELVSPYYIATHGGVVITQMLKNGFDIQIGGSGETLAYRTFINPTTPVQASRTDHVDNVGGGFGFHLGDTARIGFEVGHVTRRSPVPGLSYEGWRAGVKITYGT